MIITNTVNMDLWIRERTQEIHAVQGDSGTRKITVKLFANREPWTPEADVSVVIRYQRPDGTGGSYDTLPDGETAWELTDNAVSFVLAPQMLAIPGRVAVQVEMLWENGVLASFPLHILVEENVAAEAVKSGSYFSWEQRLAWELCKTLEQAKQSGEFTGATPELQIGEVSTLGAGEMAEAFIRGTPEHPILDLALPRGADATVDTTLSEAGKAADAAAVGAALDGKAPAGYGLGEDSKQVASCDEARESGWYIAPYPSETGVTTTGNMRVDAYSNAFFTQTFYAPMGNNYDTNYVLLRNYNGATFSPWEWANPPLFPGVEYRTMKRWDGKPVYTALIDCQYWAVGKTVTPEDITINKIIDYRGYAGSYSLPFIDNDFQGVYTAYVSVENNANHPHIVLRGKLENGYAVTHVQIWYVKD